MKKTLAAVIALAMLIALPCALAEEVPAINWEDVEPATEDIEGSWYTFNAVAMQVWVPDVLENVELTEEDDDSVIAKFMTADESAAIIVQYIEGEEGKTMDEVIPELEASGATEIDRCLLNGLDAVSYSIPDVDAAYVTLLTESGNYVQFVMTPVSDEGFQSVAQLVSASIMPEQEA